MVAPTQRFLLRRSQESDRPVLSREGGTGRGDTGRGGPARLSGSSGWPGELAWVVTPLSRWDGLVGTGVPRAMHFGLWAQAGSAGSGGWNPGARGKVRGELLLSSEASAGKAFPGGLFHGPRQVLWALRAARRGGRCSPVSPFPLLPGHRPDYISYRSLWFAEPGLTMKPGSLPTFHVSVSGQGGDSMK